MNARVTFRIDGREIWLVVDGKPTRRLTEATRRVGDPAKLVEHLEHAVRLGTAHGPCDEQAELAAALDRRNTPGHATYWRDAAGNITLTLDGKTTIVELPAGLRPLYVVGQLCNALADVCRLAGDLAGGAR